MRAAYDCGTLDLMATMGTRIREARERAGMSQAALGDSVGVRGPTVFRWEKDQMQPEPARMVRLADVLKVTEAWLRYGLEARVETDVPESFEIWKREIAPYQAPELTREVEERMLGTMFRYPREDAARWQVIYGEVLAELRGRRPKSLTNAGKEATEQAEREREALGIPKVKKSAKK